MMKNDLNLIDKIKQSHVKTALRYKIYQHHKSKDNNISRQIQNQLHDKNNYINSILSHWKF